MMAGREPLPALPQPGRTLLPTHSFSPAMTTDTHTQTELESAAFRRLLQHLREHPEVQNIDLMITADFCRNCLAKWLKAAAEEKGIGMTYEDARELIYGEPYEAWKARYQTEATPEQLKAFQERQRLQAEKGVP